tara:strand:+ start:1578 stop:2471 length:894 start_codon:yes stop_codon:yes gene_type:complete
MLGIISAKERLKQTTAINIALFGPSGVGKTTIASTLDPSRTLFVDLEAGTLALGDWGGDTIDVLKESRKMNIHPWEFSRGLACWLSGPDPAESEGPYCQASYDTYCQVFGNPEETIKKYDTIFVDSITVASRHSFQWAKQQPEALSERSGKPDQRAAYGNHGRDMVQWLTVLQHMPMSVIVCGILDTQIDEFKRETHTPQIVGAMAGRELPGIFDEVLTLQTFATDAGEQYRALVCHQMNQWNYPAKDRSGVLDILEAPDLGALMKKLKNGRRSVKTITTMPAPILETENKEETTNV